MAIIILQAGMRLYDTTWKHTDETIEELRKEKEFHLVEALSHVPQGGHLSDLQHPKYFGLTEWQPYFYGRYNDPNKKALEYTTMKPMLLMDFGANKDIDIELEQRISACFDGWIAFDDIHDTWREIYLFRPYEIIDSSSEEEYELVNYVPTSEYKWEVQELNSLRKHLMGCWNISFDIDTKTIQLLDECTTSASLVPSSKTLTDLPTEMVYAMCKEMDYATLSNFVQTNQYYKDVCSGLLKAAFKREVGAYKPISYKELLLNYDTFLPGWAIIVDHLEPMQYIVEKLVKLRIVRIEPREGQAFVFGNETTRVSLNASGIITLDGAVILSFTHYTLYAEPIIFQTPIWKSQPSAAAVKYWKRNMETGMVRARRIQ